MIGFNDTIEKLKDILSLDIKDRIIYDQDIAAALEMTPDAFKKRKQRDSVPYYEIMAFLAKRNISINWFFFKQLPESLIEPTSNFIILKYNKNSYATCGHGDDIQYEEDLYPMVIDKLMLDKIGCNYYFIDVIETVGDSMEPVIRDGSIAFIDRSQTDIINDEVYAFKLDTGIFIKKLCKTDDIITAISLNEEYKEATMDQYEIIGRVIGVLNKI